MNDRSLAWILVGLVLALALAAVAAFALYQVESARSDPEALDDYGEMPEFRFVDQEGESFGRDELEGSVALVSFQFTRCPAACVTMSRELRRLHERYEGRDDLRLVTFTVDPEHDTPEVLREYAESLGVADGIWTFLNGPLDRVVEVSEKGFLLPAEVLPAGHSSRLVLVDRGGRIRGYYDALEPEAMERLDRDLAALLDPS